MAEALIRFIADEGLVQLAIKATGCGTTTSSEVPYQGRLSCQLPLQCKAWPTRGRCLVGGIRQMLYSPHAAAMVLWYF